MKTKTITQRYLPYIITALFFLFACSEEENMPAGKGRLRLAVATNTSVISKSDPEPSTIQLTIKNKDEGWFKEYTYTEGELDIELKAGLYEIVATSGNGNGNTAGFDIPYYMGKEEVTITAGETNNATIECTLTTVKISVVYGEDVKTAFAGYSYQTVVANDSGELTFTQQEARSGYFTPGELSVAFEYDNGEEKVVIPMTNIVNAQAREHYTLKFSLSQTGVDDSEPGAGSVDIEIVGVNEENIDINIQLPGNEIINAVTLDADPWPKWALLYGETDSDRQPFFEYKLKSDSKWNRISEGVVEEGNGNYSVKLTSLTPDEEYEYRFMGRHGDVAEFKTGAETVYGIPNLSFDSWDKGGTEKLPIWYPNSEADNTYWATGNQGTVTAQKGSGTTPEEEDVVHGKAAHLKTFGSVMLVQVAAGNLFTGTYKTNMFNPASSVNFGRPYSGPRPSKLIGWYKYLSGEIDFAGDGQHPSEDIKNDLCHIYIALFTESIDDPIGYGEFYSDKTVDKYTKLEIPIEYYSDEEPTKIAIVATSSKYGGFFSGMKVIGKVSTMSELWVDEFKLEFE